MQTKRESCPHTLQKSRWEEVQFRMKETSYQQTQYAQMDNKEPLSAQAHEGTLGLITGLNLRTFFRNCTVSIWHHSVKPNMEGSYACQMNFKCRKQKILIQ